MTRRGDRGFATVAVVGLACVLLAVGTLVATLGAVAGVRHRAAAAADLAALAGARHAVEGPGPACAAADRVARAQGAVLVGCVLDGLDVLVRAAVTLPGRLGELGAAVASARAGPVGP